MNSPHRLHRTRRTGAALAAVAALALAACGDDADDATGSTSAPSVTSSDTTSVDAAPEAAIEVAGVWARSSPSMADAGAAYLTVTNHGAEADALVSAAVDPSIAATVEIHEVVPASAAGGDMGDMGEDTDEGHSDGMDSGGMGSGDSDGMDGSEMMVMQQVDRIDLAAGATVELAPGGYHVMLLGLVEPLAAGESFDLTLVFEQYGEMTVTADVRDTAP